MGFGGTVMQSIQSLRSNKQLLAKRKPLRERKRYQGITKVHATSPRNIPSNIKQTLRQAGWSISWPKTKAASLGLFITLVLVAILVFLFFIGTAILLEPHSV